MSLPVEDGEVEFAEEIGREDQSAVGVEHERLHGVNIVRPRR